MSTTADVPFIKLYESDVHEAYQLKGSKVRNMVRLRTGTKGSTVTFQKIGKAVAGPKTRHGLVPVSDTPFTNVTATLIDQYVGDWSDLLDELKTNIDERQALANAGAYSLGRKIDDLLFTAMAGTSNTNAMTLTSSITFRNDVLLSIQEHFGNDVPDDGQNFAVVTPRYWSWLMTIEEFKNADYIGGSSLPWATGASMVDWAGVKWMRHSGLPGVGSSTESSFLFHRSAVGLAEAKSVTSDITWHGDRAAHFISSMMSLGAVLIDALGVVKMTTVYATALPTS